MKVGKCVCQLIHHVACGGLAKVCTGAAALVAQRLARPVHDYGDPAALVGDKEKAHHILVPQLAKDGQLLLHLYGVCPGWVGAAVVSHSQHSTGAAADL